MRIVPKAAASNAETTATAAASPKSGPSSFLDILLSGVGIGVPATDASDARTGTPSQASHSDHSSTDEENSQPPSFQAEMSANTSTESSVLWFAKKENALPTALVPGATTAADKQPAAPSGKTSNATQSAASKPAATSAAMPARGAQPAPIVTVPIQLPLQPLPTLVAATSSLPALGDKLAAAEATDGQSAQTVNRADAPQSGQSPSQTTPATTMQQVLHVGSALPNPLLDAAESISQTSTHNSAAENDGAQQASAPVAAQISNQGFAVPATQSLVSTFLAAAISPNALTASEFTGKLNQTKTSGVTFATNANTPTASSTAATTAASAANSAKNNAQDGSYSTAKNDNQAGSDSTSHTQVDPSQAAGVKSTDSGAQQATAFETLAAAHEAAPAHSASSTTADTASHAAAEPSHLPTEGAANAAALTASINSARLIQSMSETEMRVGMHSSEFGDISIRTMVSEQQVQAQISVDHNELSNAISAHIPTMQAKFGSDLGLHATIEVNQSGMRFSGERGQSSPREQRSFSPTIPVDNTPAPIEMDRVAMRATPSYIDGSRLDIRA